MKFVSLMSPLFFQMAIAKQKFWGNCINDEDCLKYIVDINLDVFSKMVRQKECVYLQHSPLPFIRA